MKISPISLNNTYGANMAKISFGETKTNDTVKPVYSQDVTQFKAVRTNEQKEDKSFFAKTLDKVKEFFTPEADAEYNPYNGNIDEYIAARVCTI